MKVLQFSFSLTLVIAGLCSGTMATYGQSNCTQITQTGSLLCKGQEMMCDASMAPGPKKEAANLTVISSLKVSWYEQANGASGNGSLALNISWTSAPLDSVYGFKVTVTLKRTTALNLTTYVCPLTSWSRNRTFFYDFEPKGSSSITPGDAYAVTIEALLAGSSNALNTRMSTSSSVPTCSASTYPLPRDHPSCAYKVHVRKVDCCLNSFDVTFQVPSDLRTPLKIVLQRSDLSQRVSSRKTSSTVTFQSLAPEQAIAGEYSLHFRPNSFSQVRNTLKLTVPDLCSKAFALSGYKCKSRMFTANLSCPFASNVSVPYSLHSLKDRHLVSNGNLTNGVNSLVIPANYTLKGSFQLTANGGFNATVKFDCSKASSPAETNLVLLVAMAIFQSAFK